MRKLVKKYHEQGDKEKKNILTEDNIFKRLY